MQHEPEIEIAASKRQKIGEHLDDLQVCRSLSLSLSLSLLSCCLLLTYQPTPTHPLVVMVLFFQDAPGARLEHLHVGGRETVQVLTIQVR